MSATHETDWPGSGPQQRPGCEPASSDPLSPPMRDLLWCLRRTAMVQPLERSRAPHVHLLLQQRFGDHGLGLEHLLRCLVVGLAQRAQRPIRLHRPCQSALSPDEWRLLTALAEAGRPARVAAVLAPLTGSRGGELAPLLAGMAALLPR